MADGAGRHGHEKKKADSTSAKAAPSTWSRLPRYLLAFVIGTIGAVIFVYLHLPLPWYLGALTACLIASVAHLPVERPRPLAGPLRATLGVAVGSAFTPHVLGNVGAMAGSLIILVPFMILITTTSMTFYRRLAGFDRPTAFFSAVPGGLADMTAMAEQAGANQRTVILVQASRIVLIVFTVPLFLQFHDGLAAPNAFAASPVRLSELTFVDAATLIAMAGLGWGIAQYFGLAGAPIVGPMVVSGIAHALGLTTVRLPLELLIVAQIGVGVLLGCQFRGLTFKEFTHTMVWGLLNAAVLLAVTAVVVILVSRITGFDQVSVLMAFAPGGQTELNLLAFVLGVDVAYVALHHLARLAIVILGAQLVFKTQKSWRQDGS
jgi:membrane AbrB-like protein